MHEPAASDRLAPARKGTPPLTSAEITAQLAALPYWSLIDAEGIAQLQRIYAFSNFADALAFANRIGALAERADHHPALTVEWGRVTVRWWTHVIGGLHANDFLLAAATERTYHDGH